MRSYTDFNQARNEIRRDLNELGRTIFAGYQSMKVDAEKIGDLTTKELTNYDYVVIDPKFEDLRPVQPWADAEWDERLAGINNRPVNPGKAWELRENLWRPLLEDDGQFSYTYSQRLFTACLPEMATAMRQNPHSRQIYVSIWDPQVDALRLGRRRVPCTLGYQLMVRDGRMDVTYHMRSSDFQSHWENDCWMALQIQQWFANELDVPRGTFTHVIGSFHVYASEVAGVF